MATLEVRTQNTKTLVQVLGALMGEAGSAADVDVTAQAEKGLHLLVEDKTIGLQSNATLKESMFSMFSVRPGEEEPEDVCFSVPIRVWHECLQVFGTAGLDETHLNLTYLDSTAELKLMMTEGDALTEISIATTDLPEPSESYAARFRSADVVGRVVMPSSLLDEAAKEVCDMRGAASIMVEMMPEAPYMRLNAGTNTGSVTVDFPGGHDSFVQFNVPSYSAYSYRIESFRRLISALPVAKETFIQMGAGGLLSISHKVESADGSVAFITSYLCPAEEDDEEEEEEEEEERVVGEEGLRQGYF